MGINDWEASDCPWTEHSRFNADCTYLSLFNDNFENKPHHSKCVDETKQNAQFDNRNCRDCNENEANTACLPCGHILFCETCVEKHPSCAVCDNSYYFYVKIYIA